ncbi:hypothetical protein HK405_003260, partial [Cladochytrium tenue]
MSIGDGPPSAAVTAIAPPGAGASAGAAAPAAAAAAATSATFTAAVFRRATAIWAELFALVEALRAVPDLDRNTFCALQVGDQSVSLALLDGWLFSKANMCATQKDLKNAKSQALGTMKISEGVQATNPIYFGLYTYLRAITKRRSQMATLFKKKFASLFESNPKVKAVVDKWVTKVDTAAGKLKKRFAEITTSKTLNAIRPAVVADADVGASGLKTNPMASAE